MILKLISTVLFGLGLAVITIKFSLTEEYDKGIVCLLLFGGLWLLLEKAINK